MHRPSLTDASYEALLRLADTYGTDVPENATRDELEEIVEDAIEEWLLDQKVEDSHSVRVEESKFDLSAESERLRETEESIDLPETYNETRVVLMLRDPSWAFAYWDLSESDRASLQKAEEFQGLLLRVYSMDSGSMDVTSTTDHFEIPVTLLDNRWYINLPDQERLYRLALVARVDDRDSILTLSNPIAVPRGMVAEQQAGDEKEKSSQSVDQILAQTGIRDFDVTAGGKQIPQRILDLVDEELLFH